MLDVFEPVFRETGYKARWCIDHAETISDEELAPDQGDGRRHRRAGPHGVRRRDTSPSATARRRPRRRRRCGKMLDAGIPVGAGTDATRVSSHNPWLSLYWMVTGKTVGGTQLASPENRLSRDEALRLYTVGSAWFSGEEEREGPIAPGEYADFAVLGADYFTFPRSRSAHRVGADGDGRRRGLRRGAVRERRAARCRR